MTPRGRSARQISALVAAACYAGFAGWGVPVRRAWLLLLAAGAGMLRARPARFGPPLAAAGLWIAAREPGALFEPGAQLSFAVVAALGLGAARASAAAPIPGSETLRRSATAGLAAAPILAWHGGGLSPVALAANVLVLPWLAGVALPAALLAAAALAVAASGAEWLAGSAAWLAEAGVARITAVAAGLPPVEHAPVSLAGWIPLVLLAALGLASASTRLRCGLALAQVAWLAVAPAASFQPGPPRLVALEVGQGDAILVQGRRAALLLDAGPARDGWDAGRQRVLPALRALGVERLELLVATHADLDHRGGLPAVLAALPVGELWLPAGRADDPGFEPLLEAARRAGTAWREVGRGSPRRRWGELEVEPLWPPRSAPLTRNAASLVLRVAVRGGSRVLLPGDLDAAAEARLRTLAPDLRAEVLVLPHHGSRGSGSPGFLDAVAPQLAIASAGCRNRFGMPHAELRGRLAERRIPLWWTGRDGAVRVDLGREPKARGTGSRADCEPVPAPAP